MRLLRHAETAFSYDKTTLAHQSRSTNSIPQIFALSNISCILKSETADIEKEMVWIIKSGGKLIAVLLISLELGLFRAATDLHL